MTSAKPYRSLVQINFRAGRDVTEALDRLVAARLASSPGAMSGALRSEIMRSLILAEDARIRQEKLGK